MPAQLFFGDIEPDNHKNHNKYNDAPTCVRCGRAVRSGGGVLRLSRKGEYIDPNEVPDNPEHVEYALGSECQKRVPATHRKPLTDEARERIMARDRAIRAQGSALSGAPTGLLGAIAESERVLEAILKGKHV